MLVDCFSFFIMQFLIVFLFILNFIRIFAGIFENIFNIHNTSTSKVWDHLFVGRNRFSAKCNKTNTLLMEIY